MRLLLAVGLLFCLKVSAQLPVDYCKQVKDIATMERDAHQRLMNGADQTLASNNFTVTYYRCEWEVDPASYYITGKITAYFLMTASGSSISLDLMNSMTVDSIK